MRALPPGGVIRDTLRIQVDSLSQPWWLAKGRDRGMFSQPASAAAENRRLPYPAVNYPVLLGGQPSVFAYSSFLTPITWRRADQVRGEVVVRSEASPAILVSLDQLSQYAPAGGVSSMR